MGLWKLALFSLAAAEKAFLLWIVKRMSISIIAGGNDTLKIGCPVRTLDGWGRYNAASKALHRYLLPSPSVSFADSVSYGIPAHGRYFDLHSLRYPVGGALDGEPGTGGGNRDRVSFFLRKNKGVPAIYRRQQQSAGLLHFYGFDPGFLLHN